MPPLKVIQMMWDALFSALALVFIFEGILPFLSPPFWRRALQMMLMQTDTAVRVMGLVSMLIGLGLLFWVRRAVGE